MKYYIIAGEASGDLHASNLIREIFKKDPQAQIRCWGGDLMENEGAELVKHYRDLAFMGIIPVILNSRTILRNLEFCKSDLLQFNPDAVIFVDYPGFNLKIAKFAKSHHLKTIYYISPKIWAWKTKRVHQIKANIDLMLTIFPFETEFYKKYNYPVTYVGNPLFDAINLCKNITNSQHFRTQNHIDQKPIIAILPGSRKHEITMLLPIMAKTSELFPEWNFIVAGAPNIDDNLYGDICKRLNVKLVRNQTYDLLQNASIALVASGTATLETALFNIPQVVCYKMGFGTVLEKFRSFILKVPFFSLVNLIGEREIVKELFQSQLTLPAISSELLKINNDQAYKQSIIEGYQEISKKLMTPESASATAAYYITNFTNKK